MPRGFTDRYTEGAPYERRRRPAEEAKRPPGRKANWNGPNPGVRFTERIAWARHEVELAARRWVESGRVDRILSAAVEGRLRDLDRLLALEAFATPQPTGPRNPSRRERPIPLTLPVSRA